MTMTDYGNTQTQDNSSKCLPGSRHINTQAHSYLCMPMYVCICSLANYPQAYIPPFILWTDMLELLALNKCWFIFKALFIYLKYGRVEYLLFKCVFSKVKSLLTFWKIASKVHSTVKMKNNSKNINPELFPEDAAHWHSTQSQPGAVLLLLMSKSLHRGKLLLDTRGWTRLSRKDHIMTGVRAIS